MREFNFVPSFVCGRHVYLRTYNGGKSMSLPSQTMQKTKPLLIAVGVIICAVVFVSQAPHFVQWVNGLK